MLQDEINCLVYGVARVKIYDKTIFAVHGLCCLYGHLKTYLLSFNTVKIFWQIPLNYFSTMKNFLVDSTINALVNKNNGFGAIFLIHWMLLARDLVKYQNRSISHEVSEVNSLSYRNCISVLISMNLIFHTWMLSLLTRCLYFNYFIYVDISITPSNEYIY